MELVRHFFSPGYSLDLPNLMFSYNHTKGNLFTKRPDKGLLLAHARFNDYKSYNGSLSRLFGRETATSDSGRVLIELHSFGWFIEENAYVVD